MMAVSVLVLFSGCRMVENSTPLFWAGFEIALGEKYSDYLALIRMAQSVYVG